MMFIGAATEPVKRPKPMWVEWLKSVAGLIFLILVLVCMGAIFGMMEG